MGNGDSYCGIYCGACPILLHGESGSRDVFIECCPDLPKGELSCGGCKSSERYAPCESCDIRNCAVSKNLGHCAECPDYPCKTFKNWRSFKILLPHLKDPPANNEIIRGEGADNWLATQKARWSCPKCGAAFSWYASACANCGVNLKEKAFGLNAVRKSLCGVILPLAYKRAKKKSR